MYVISLAMFSYHVLIRNQMTDCPIKWIMFIMVSALALDEFRQVKIVDFFQTNAPFIPGERKSEVSDAAEQKLRKKTSSTNLT